MSQTVATPYEFSSEILSETIERVTRDLMSPVIALEGLKRKELLTPKEVEQLYGLNARTLTNKRGIGRGPVYIQAEKGGPVFYEHKAIHIYLQTCRKKSND